MLIKATECTRCDVVHNARGEMIVRLEDFLRRRSKIALVVRHENIRNFPGLLEACRSLFGDGAQAQLEACFADEPQKQRVAT